MEATNVLTKKEEPTLKTHFLEVRHMLRSKFFDLGFIKLRFKTGTFEHVWSPLQTQSKTKFRKPKYFQILIPHQIQTRRRFFFFFFLRVSNIKIWQERDIILKDPRKCHFNFSYLGYWILVYYPRVSILVSNKRTLRFGVFLVVDPGVNPLLSIWFCVTLKMMCHVDKVVFIICHEKLIFGRNVMPH